MRRWAIRFLSRAHLAAYRLSRGRAFGSEHRLTVDHLIDDATDGGYDDGTRLPRRLGDGQPKARGEALLHHDCGVPLKSVDDDRVLDRIVHRDTREMGKGLPR